jgi:SAM-dependent methyltransferase
MAAEDKPHQKEKRVRVTGDSMYQDGRYLASNPNWHQEDSEWKARQIHGALLANGIAPSTLAEIGCGAGAVLSALADLYPENVSFSGYEISPQAFEICRTKSRRNIQYHLDDLLSADAWFEVVMAIDVFEHVEDYIGFLRRLKSKGAVKVFHIPLDLSVQTVLRSSPILNARASVGHIHYFTRETALATLRDCGYEILHESFTCGTLDLPTSGWKAPLLRFPRRMMFRLHQNLAARIFGGFSLLVLAK